MIGYSLSQRKSTTYDERIMEISLGLWWEGYLKRELWIYRRLWIDSYLLRWKNIHEALLKRTVSPDIRL